MKNVLFQKGDAEEAIPFSGLTEMVGADMKPRVKMGNKVRFARSALILIADDRFHGRVFYENAYFLEIFK